MATIDHIGLAVWNRDRGEDYLTRARAYWDAEAAAGRRPDMLHVRRLLREADVRIGCADAQLAYALDHPAGGVSEP